MKFSNTGIQWAAIACALATTTASANPHNSDESAPTGLWVWSAPESSAQVSLEISRHSGRWSVRVDGQVVKVKFEDGALSIELLDGQRFAGTVDPDSQTLAGHWFQPPTDLDYQYIATPVTVPAMGSGQWMATLEVQPRPYHVFLDIFDQDDGATAAVIRNPEGNNILGATRFRFEDAQGAGFSLVSGGEENTVRHALKVGKANTLSLQYDRFDAPITLVPASEEDKRLYYSRHGAKAGGSLARPENLNDGWAVAAPEEVGFDPAKLAELTEVVGSLDPRRQRPQLIHSILVSKGGKLVYEEYFYGHDRRKRHDVRSLGKVFGSVMVGALRQQGHDIAPDHRTVASVLASAGHSIDDERKAQITLAHLMTYTSGLDCDVNRDSPGSEGRMWAQEDEPNYWLYTSKLPLLHEPGTRYAYCSGSANLVGAALREFGKASVYELFDRLIAQPLQFGRYHWALSPNGEGYLGGGAYVRPRDILKIGAMYTAQGAWNGTQVIEKDWVGHSTEPKLVISPETTGMSQDEFQNNYFGGSQAYIWQSGVIGVDDREFASYQASGNGGQLLIVVPEFDLAVAINGGNYRMGGVWGRWGYQIVGNYILRALVESPEPE
ncbi:MAG: serine hydrolase [Pseudomonadota bacterium]